jgi:hypothetical protein
MDSKCSSSRNGSRGLAVTVLGVLLVAAFYVSVERLAEWRKRPGPATPPPRPEGVRNDLGETITDR